MLIVAVRYGFNNLSKCKESDVRFASAVAEFMSLMVQHCPEEFDRVGWDCPMIATASWILSINKTVGSGDTFYGSLVILSFSCCGLSIIQSNVATLCSSPDLKSDGSPLRALSISELERYHYMENEGPLSSGLLRVLLNELSLRSLESLCLRFDLF
ncbi:hypothetical protein LSTR_LSTR016189 [Laodelphax striatellus]|uniref:Uncharacterized protein n=1 Tax=Laodelphax striatellus TaxID=195883 RepID=A0A482WQ93_LAOST|nr:hypothetical protein LSTR_LSTR016189 [Laodelphax striatellus]